MLLPPSFQTGRRSAMAPRTPQPLLAALAEHPRQGTPHRGELTRSIEAADNRARDRLSDDPDAVYGVWKCLRTVRVAAISKTRARYVNARTTTDGAPPASRPAGTRPQAVVVHAEPRSDPPTRAAAPAAVQEVRDTTPARPTRAPPSPARTHSDQRAGRLLRRRRLSFLRDRFNFCKDYSPADGGDVIKLIRVVYKSFSEHVMDAARRGSLTVRPEVFLNPRPWSLVLEVFTPRRVFASTRVSRFAVRKMKSGSQTRPAPRTDRRTARTLYPTPARDGAATDQHPTRRTEAAGLSRASRATLTPKHPETRENKKKRRRSWTSSRTCARRRRRSRRVPQLEGVRAAVRGGAGVRDLGWRRVRRDGPLRVRASRCARTSPSRSRPSEARGCPDGAARRRRRPRVRRLRRARRRRVRGGGGARRRRRATAVQPRGVLGRRRGGRRHAVDALGAGDARVRLRVCRGRAGHPGGRAPAPEGRQGELRRRRRGLALWARWTTTARGRRSSGSSTASWTTTSPDSATPRRASACPRARSSSPARGTRGRRRLFWRRGISFEFAFPDAPEEAQRIDVAYATCLRSVSDTEATATETHGFATRSGSVIALGVRERPRGFGRSDAVDVEDDAFVAFAFDASRFAQAKASLSRAAAEYPDAFGAAGHARFLEARRAASPLKTSRGVACIVAGPPKPLAPIRTARAPNGGGGGSQRTCQTDPHAAEDRGDVPRREPARGVP